MNIKTAKSMARVYSLGKMVVIMKENSKMVLKMALEFIHGLMEISTKVNLKTINSMAKV